MIGWSNMVVFDKIYHKDLRCSETVFLKCWIKICLLFCFFFFLSNSINRCFKCLKKKNSLHYVKLKIKRVNNSLQIVMQYLDNKLAIFNLFFIYLSFFFLCACKYNRKSHLFVSNSKTNVYLFILHLFVRLALVRC